MAGLATSTIEPNAVAQLIAEVARRLSTSTPREGEDESDMDCEDEPLPQWPRDAATPSPRERCSSWNSSGQQAPFRRSISQPENPTSDMGDLAMAEESSEMPHSSAKKLVLLRRFSVSEQDIVVCNRVRCGVDPSWFRHRSRSASHDSRRYQRSLSVEEARLAATRRRMGLGTSSKPPSSAGSSAASSRRSSGLAPMRFAVPENEPLDDPALVSADLKLASPRSRGVTSLPEEEEEGEDDELPRYSTGMGPAPLTPREKAMHGRYLIRESFARGSYGNVCDGESVSSHQEVAVKIIPKYILVSPEEKQSVIREQIIHKSLNHPHIIKLIDVFEDDGAHYFILERADNKSLSTLITYAGMPEDQARDVFRQLLQALEYLHVNNIVHHDIKPHNILLQKGGGDIKLCDFGASRAFNADEASLPFAGVFGTPGYIAPELLLGDKAYGPAIDMFSAGILLFEMVFGYTPFYPPSACTYQPLDFPPRTPVTDDARDLIARLLEKVPQQRITASQALGHPWITLGAGGRSAPNSPVGTPKRLLSPRAKTRLERSMSTF